jgi:hypothetical protein
MLHASSAASPLPTLNHQGWEATGKESREPQSTFVCPEVDLRAEKN